MTLIRSVPVSSEMPGNVAVHAAPAQGGPATQPRERSVAPQQAPVAQSSLADRALVASRTHLGCATLSRVAESSRPGALPLQDQSGAVSARRKKDSVYLSQKRPNHNLNMNVVLPRSEIDAAGSTEVACRHLAFEYFNSPNKARFLNTVKDEASIKAHFSGGTLRSAHQGVMALKSAANLENTCVVSVDMLSVQVMHLAHTLTQRQQTSADFLLTTTDHAMALHMQIKEQGRVCVSLYDPNNTTNHFRVEAANYRDLDALETIEKPLQHFRQDGYHAFTLYGKDNFFTPSEALRNRLGSDQSTPDQITTAFVGLALDRNDPQLLEQLLGAVASEYPKGGPALKAVLEASDHGFPGMFTALQNGHAQTVSTWMKGVRHFAEKGLLTPDDVFDLFKSQARSGNASTDGLAPAMDKGHTATISAFLEQVTEAAASGLLTRPQVKELFTAPDIANVPATHELWRHADLPSMAVVVEQLRRCHQHQTLSGKDIHELLMATTPGMEKVAAGGASGQMKAFEHAFQPLVNAKVLQKKQVKALLVAHGFVDKSFKATLARAFS
ncbi:ShET2/EspL2 family type III secretion system effector toxin [Pseudomonas sp. SDO528_S397]